MKQICIKCEIEKSNSEFSIRKENGKLRKDCKSCCAERTRQYSDRKMQNLLKDFQHDYILIEQSRKECSKCNKIKLGKFFHKIKSNIDGLSSHCKECDKKYSRDRIFENTKHHNHSEEDLVNIKRICNICNEEKSLQYFSKSSNSKLGFGKRCKDCHNKQVESHRNTPKGKYQLYQHSAKDRDINFSLSFEEFITFWQMPCTYCKSEIKTIGLDRKNSEIGYIIENIAPCCHICNAMKSDLSYDEWISHMKLILNNIDKLEIK